jgi:hypothetical protein
VGETAGAPSYVGRASPLSFYKPIYRFTPLPGSSPPSGPSGHTKSRRQLGRVLPLLFFLVRPASLSVALGCSAFTASDRVSTLALPPGHLAPLPTRENQNRHPTFPPTLPSRTRPDGAPQPTLPPVASEPQILHTRASKVDEMAHDPHCGSSHLPRPLSREAHPFPRFPFPDFRFAGTASIHGAPVFPGARLVSGILFLPPSRRFDKGGGHHEVDGSGRDRHGFPEAALLPPSLRTAASLSRSFSPPGSAVGSPYTPATAARTMPGRVTPRIKGRFGGGRVTICEDY